MANTNTASKGGDNGFFSVLESVASNALEGFGRGLNAVLPAWTAKSLDSQLYDQLYRPTYNDAAATRQSLYTGGTSGGGDSWQQPQPQKAGVLFDNVTIGGDALVVGGAIMIGVAVLFLAAKG